MSKRVKGITIQINGDTTGLDKALSGVEKNARKAQTELNDINKLLRLDPNNTNLVAQKMQVLGEAVSAAETKLSSLRQAQQQVQRQFDNGDIGADQYRAFMRELTDTEESLSSYKRQIQSVQTEQDNLGKATKQMQRFFDATGKRVEDFADVLGEDLVRAIKEGRATSTQLENAFDRMGQSALGANADLERLRTSLRTLDSGGSLDDVRRDLQDIEREANQAEKSVGDLSGAFGALGGIVAGIGIGGIVEKALEASDLNAKIDVTFDVPEESKASVRQALADVKKYGVDGAEALEGIRRQWALNKNATDESNASIVEGAAAIVKSYSRVDFIELIQEVNEIAGELKTSDEEALNLVNSLLKIGFPDEQIDTIAEYGGQLRRAGFELKQIQGILAAAVSTDSWNIDNLLDGLKEGRVKAAEFGLGLSESFKTNLRGITNTVKAASEEQISAMQNGFSKQENALSKSLSNQEKQLSKSHDKQKKAFDKQLSAEYDAASKTYDKKQKAFEKSLDNEMKALEKANNEKLKMLDAEYMAKLKVLDKEEYDRLVGIDKEIKALEAKTEAENKAAEAADIAERRAQLKRNISRATTFEDRKNAEHELNKYNEELRIKALQNERKDKIENLKAEKDNIKDAFDEKKDVLKDEHDLQKEQLQEINNADNEALQERQALQKEAFADQKTLALNAIREEHAERKDALNERLSYEAERVRDAHQAELESFKQMNAEKLELAKNPPDSAAYKELEAQLEAWGTAIAKGGEEGAKAFEDMIFWLDSLEDGALKNAVGVELLGTKFEDQGQNIIDAIVNSKKAMQELETSVNSVKDSTSRMNDGNAAVSVAEAFEKMKVAIEPLLLAIAKIIDVVATLMGKFPVLSSIIIGLLAVFALLAAALAFIPPFIAAVTAGFAAIGPAIAFVGGLLSTLAGVVLPAIAAAFAFIISPIGLAIAAIVAIIGIVVLVIKKWSPIKDFFKNLWSGIVDIFKSTAKWLGDIAQKIGTSIMKPIEKMRDGIINAFTFVKTTLTNIWDGIVNIIKTPLNAVIQMLNKFISGINKVKVPDWIPVIGGKSVKIPEIPMLAKGTNYFKGGMAIVGEKGPELVEMPTGTRVNNATKTSDLLGGHGGVHINIEEMVVRNDQDIKSIARELYHYEVKAKRGG